MGVDPQESLRNVVTRESLPNVVIREFNRSLLIDSKTVQICHSVILFNSSYEELSEMQKCKIQLKCWLVYIGRGLTDNLQPLDSAFIECLKNVYKRW